jgi:hypothetical protein
MSPNDTRGSLAMSAFSAAISGITDIKRALIRAAPLIYEVHSLASAPTGDLFLPAGMWLL